VLILKEFVKGFLPVRQIPSGYKSITLRRTSVKYFFNRFLLLICFFLPSSLSADCVNDPVVQEYEEKLYFDTNDLEIGDNLMYIHLEDNWIATNVIRTDQQGFYIFGNDITDCGITGEREKKWKCPYCNHWWPMGQKCQNPKCPTNQW